LFWGELRHETLGELTFVDEKNNIRCEFEFNNVKGLPSDVVCGAILRGPPGGEDDEELSSLFGSWLGFVDWDGKRYWDINKHKPEIPTESPNPLPSDSRFRGDVIELTKGQMDAAQRAKEQIEEAQRRDRRLRKSAEPEE